MSEISTNSSSNIIKVSEIGMAFGREYYTVLSREPSRLHLFYAKNSTLLHADEGDLDTPISIGSEAIQNAVNKNSFLGARFIIGSIDCHPSQNGGILVNVLGQIQKRGQSTNSSRHFMQTFFLAEQPSGYFILNDNLRFLERPNSSSPTTPVTTNVAVEATPAPAAVSAPAPIVEAVVEAVPEVIPTPQVAVPVAEIVAETEAVAPTATKVKKITTAASKQRSSNPTSPVATAPSTPVVEEILSSPSSWAQLAAVQQNKWATGVVSLNKGTSIPSEEKPKVVSTQNRKKSNEQENSNSYTTSSNNSSSAVNNNNNNTTNNNNTRRTDSSAKTSRLPFVPEASLYITGVTNNLKSDAIRAEFAALGALAHFDVKYNSSAAFVEYADPAIAKILLEEGGIVVNGTRLTVEKRRVASRNNNNNFPSQSSDNNSTASSSNSKDKDSASSKKFIATKSNRRERPAANANKTAAAPTTA